jgi:hypothetical protein
MTAGHLLFQYSQSLLTTLLWSYLKPFIAVHFDDPVLWDFFHVFYWTIQILSYHSDLVKWTNIVIIFSMTRYISFCAICRRGFYVFIYCSYRCPGSMCNLFVAHTVFIQLALSNVVTEFCVVLTSCNPGLHCVIDNYRPCDSRFGKQEIRDLWIWYFHIVQV